MSDMHIEQVLAQIRSLSAQVQSGGNVAATAPKPTGEISEFAQLHKQGVDSVNTAQQRAGALSDAFERGTQGVELADVMLEMQKASVSFRALTEVRNRLVTAYQDIMNMPL
jgi:flagellar hook-basal body complex protein FliE